MSSEMRELLKKYETRLANWTREHDQCANEWAYAHRRQCSDIVDDLRALLARTEAGAPHHPLAICPTCKDYYEVCECTPDAAPVADGAVAWMREGATTVMHNFRFDKPQAGPWIPLYTHPQDASGDAELLDWLVENEFDLVTRREDMGEDEYAIWWFVIDSRKSSPWRLHTVSGHPLGSPREAIIAAMQAKEAK